MICETPLTYNTWLYPAKPPVKTAAGDEIRETESEANNGTGGPHDTRVLFGLVLREYGDRRCSKPQWSKAGLSQADVKAQEDACWNYVLNTPEGRQKVKTFRTLQVIVGGPIMLLTFNKKNPKEESANAGIFGDCMRGHGFRQ